VSLIATRDLSFSYQNRPVLEEINLTIEEGEFIAIIGPNGGGKTTLLRLMVGLLTPTTGSVTISGKAPHKVREQIGYVPQRTKTDPEFPVTTYDLILTGAARQSLAFGRYPKKIKNKADELIDQLHLKEQKKSPFHTLSGGMQQKAFIARSLMTDPAILFLDESMSGIDTPTKKELLTFLLSLKGKMTILMVTHDLHIAVEQVQRFICVEKKAQMMQPKDVCEHFAIGLYHSPLGEHD
jgi:zinc transport system ATP-binding protein